MINITIGDTTRKNMKLLGIVEYPFTIALLKQKYFAVLSKVHPDKNNGNGDVKLTREVIEAYSWLKNLSIECISPGEPKKKMKSDDIFSLWVCCESCGGSGSKTVWTHSVICHDCLGDGWNWKLWKPNEIVRNYESGRKVCCKSCNGRGYRVSGTEVRCFKCKGLGEYELDLNNPVIPKGAVLI